MTIIVIAVLAVVFQLKHFVADYPLQRPWMLLKFREDWSFFLPLLSHAFVHAVLTLLIGLVWCLLIKVPLGLAFWCAGVDLVVHFTMDRLKAGPRWLGRFKPLFGQEYVDALPYADVSSYDSPTKKATYFSPEGDEARRKLRGNTLFWWSLGLDQMVHHLTHYYIIYRLIIG